MERDHGAGDGASSSSLAGAEKGDREARALWWGEVALEAEVVGVSSTSASEGWLEISSVSMSSERGVSGGVPGSLGEASVGVLDLECVAEGLCSSAG